MKKHVFGIIVCLLISCKKDNIILDSLYHTWQPTVFYQNKIEKGQWSEWRSHQEVANETLTFTKDGKILYNGQPANSCCRFYNFRLEQNVIKLLSPSKSPDCILVDCSPITEWKIVKLTEDTLELEQFNYRSRYTR